MRHKNMTSKENSFQNLYNLYIKKKHHTACQQDVYQQVDRKSIYKL